LRAPLLVLDDAAADLSHRKPPDAGLAIWHFDEAGDNGD
jgi:hypothetical protein